MTQTKTKPIRHPVLAQVVEAYKRMAGVGYRPSAPSDGFGNITVSLDRLDLDQEAREYAARWWSEEDKGGEFWVGYCNFPTRPATIYAIEAARSLCGVQNGVALALLRLAVADLEGSEDDGELVEATGRWGQIGDKVEVEVWDDVLTEGVVIGFASDDGEMGIALDKDQARRLGLRLLAQAGDSE